MNSGPDRADVTVIHRILIHTPRRKQEYLLGSRFAKRGSSTIYKLNRNFHYFRRHSGST